jgi:asparagine synthase (glutamine-hydrolysing)
MVLIFMPQFWQRDYYMCGFLVLETDQKTYDKEQFKVELKKITHRGPDDHQIVELESIIFGFHRLSIMDLSDHGRQPFKSKSHSHLVCNGEIYNYKELKNECSDHEFISHSDCEVLLPLYESWGIEKLCQSLDAEFALVIYDAKKDLTLAARDPMGIRPLFFGKTKEGKHAFASEAKSLLKYCDEIMPFPPGHYFDGVKLQQYHSHYKKISHYQTEKKDVLFNIRTKLIDGVHKRLQSDAEVGFLLSGGLDSSLVCAIAQSMKGTPIRTFSIGMTDDAIDSKYAADVAKFIKSNHTNVIMTKEDVISSLRTVIFHLETWDITTIRASIGMYLVCKYIKENTNIKVLLTGEVSDELFGYKYTDFAPTAEEFQKESEKRVRELYLYDVLRADRSISAHSLEARVPFSDKDFVDYVMSIDPRLKMNTTGMGKYLLRAAFDQAECGTKWLPDHILWREKAAFSDAVGHSMVDELKAYAESMYSDEEFERIRVKYNYKTPYTKESLLYREIFEELYPIRAGLIPDYWLPNQTWENCKVLDPSARVLPNYGLSGK